jgi:hypothetical protein
MLPILTAALLLGAPPPMPSAKTADRELLPMPRRLGASYAQDDASNAEYLKRRTDLLKVECAAVLAFHKGEMDDAIKMLSEHLAKLRQMPLDQSGGPTLLFLTEQRLEYFKYLKKLRVEEAKLWADQMKSDAVREQDRLRQDLTNLLYFERGEHRLETFKTLKAQFKLEAAVATERAKIARDRAQRENGTGGGDGPSKDRP